MHTFSAECLMKRHSLIYFHVITFPLYISVETGGQNVVV